MSKLFRKVFYISKIFDPYFIVNRKPQMVTGKGTIDTRNTLSSIIKDELIITDDSNFTNVCIKGTKTKQYLIYLKKFFSLYSISISK